MSFGFKMLNRLRCCNRTQR